MKTSALLIAIPLFAFFAAAFSLDPGRYLPLIPEADITAYMAARSIASEGNLAFSSADSDRYFKEYGQRPSRIKVAKKKILASDGQYREYLVFSLPEVFVFALVPFVWAFGFKGWLVLHAICIGILYWIGISFYGSGADDSKWSAINSILYFTLILTPIIFLMPTHHLFLLTVITAAVFAGIKNYPIIAAALLAVAMSSQPWTILVSLFLVAYWQFSGLKSEPPRFIVSLILFGALVFGIEWLMYPPSSTSETRWLGVISPPSILQIWSTLPVFETRLFATPTLQRLTDFVFGRTAGFLAYATAALCILLASLWHLRDRLVNRGIAFAILVLLSVCFVPFPERGLAYFTDDFVIMLCAVAFFLCPIVRPNWFLIVTVAISAIFAGPLLLNPLGALSSRNYYLQSFPYRFLPQELELIGEHGLTVDPAYRLNFSAGVMYFLNQNFYVEKDFIWVRGQSTLEFIIELNSPDAISHLQIQNGVVPNRISVHLGKRDEFFPLRADEKTLLDLSKFKSYMKMYQGKYYLHGTITSESGYVPKLLIRENPDFRYLGCRIQPFSKHTIPQ
jgi:hypothetical protein